MHGWGRAMQGSVEGQGHTALRRLACRCESACVCGWVGGAAKCMYIIFGRHPCTGPCSLRLARARVQR